ncbi:MAG: hypothetical protein JWO64_1114 [Hyphomicrobiales bacterium]|nr:hypothetical protein [Hyphomicrobiales bacterium]
MGLLDSLIGTLGGSSASSRAPGGSSTSPIVKAILLLLAAKAAQSMTSRSSAQTPDTAGTTSVPSGGLGGPSGGLGGLLQGGLAGGALGGLFGGLVDQLRKSGYGDQVDSWIGAGQNKPIAPHDMARALGPDTLGELEQHTGLSRDQLLAELSHELPASIDHVTPGGRVPSDEEIWSGPGR